VPSFAFWRARTAGGKVTAAPAGAEVAAAVAGGLAAAGAGGVAAGAIGFAAGNLDPKLAGALCAVGILVTDSTALLRV